MCEMLLILFNLLWDNEFVPAYWRQGLIVTLFKQGDRKDPDNYRGITLLNVVRKLKYLESEHKLHEGQGGFRLGGSCIDNTFSINGLIQGRMKEVKSTYAFFLTLRTLMTHYGGMGYGIKCGKWVLIVRCGE